MGKAGRPSDYDPEICEKLLDLMAGGLSLTAACGELGFYRQRAYEWAEKHEALADAIRLGQAKRTTFLERRMLGATEGPVVTSSIFALKNSAPDEWRDRVVQEVTGKDGGAIEVAEVTDRERAKALLAVLSRADAEKSST